MKFRRQFNSKYKGTSGEKNSGISQTVPDMALSVRELLENHSRGQESDARHYQGEYFEETEIPQFDDITELQEYRKDLEAKSEALKDKTKTERSEASKKRKAAREAAKTSQTAPKGARTANEESTQKVPGKGTKNED